MNRPVRELEDLVSGRHATSALAPKATISVVVVVYRTGPALENCIACILKDHDTFELILVDNGSSPQEAGWMQAAAATHAKVKLLVGHGNVGFAQGANLGVRASSGQVVVFVNPDAFVQPGCLSTLREGVGQGPRPCLIGARILNADGGEQRGARRGEVTPMTTLFSILRLTHVLKVLSRFEIHHENDPTPEGRIEVPTISGAGFAMTREDFDRLGGFDEDYFLHVEDIDLCWRVRQAGGKVWFDPSANLVHLGSTSLSNPMKIEVWKGVGLIRYFRKRATNPIQAGVAIALAPAILAAAIVRALLRKRTRKVDQPQSI